MCPPCPARPAFSYINEHDEACHCEEEGHDDTAYGNHRDLVRGMPHVLHGMVGEDGDDWTDEGDKQEADDDERSET